MPGPGINGRFGAAACGILDTFVAHDAGAGFKLPHLAREAGSQLKTADHPADDSRRHALAAPPALLLIPGSCAATDRRYERKGARMSAQGLGPLRRISRTWTPPFAKLSVRDGFGGIDCTRTSGLSLQQSCCPWWDLLVGSHSLCRTRGAADILGFANHGL